MDDLKYDLLERGRLTLAFSVLSKSDDIFENIRLQEQLKCDLAKFLHEKGYETFIIVDPELLKEDLVRKATDENREVKIGTFIQAQEGKL